MPSRRIRYIGSRELHRDLPKVLDTLEDRNARVVLTVHSKPKAVLIGAEAFQALLSRSTPEDRLLALQLGALVRGLEPCDDSRPVGGEAHQPVQEPPSDNRRPALGV